MANELLKRFVDPRTVRVTPASRTVAEQIMANAVAIEEHRRQVGKHTMDAGEDHFFTQRNHLVEFFRLQGEQAKLLKRFDVLEGRALAMQLLRNVVGIKEELLSRQD